MVLMTVILGSLAILDFLTFLIWLNPDWWERGLAEAYDRAMELHAEWHAENPDLTCHGYGACNEKKD